MKRFFLFCCLAFTCVAAFSQGYSELFEGEGAAALRSLTDSLSGLTSEAELAAFIPGKLEKSGLELFESADSRQFGIRRESGDTVTFHNVISAVPGYDRSLREKYIVVGTRLAPDNSAAVAAFLSLASKVATNRVMMKRSFIFAAFGGSEEANAGSWYFLNRAFPDRQFIDCYVNLDLFDNPNKGFYVYTSSNASLNRIVSEAEKTLQPAKPSLVSAEPANSDHRTFYGGEIPSVFFTTAEPGKIYRRGIDHMEFDELDRQCEYIYNFLVTLANGPAPSFWPEDEQAVPVVSFADCDTKPRFLGSSNPSAFLAKWVYVYLKYPEYAVDNGIQGQVLVDMMIDEKGKVCNVRVRKGVHSSLDKEAVRVIEASPDWKPGLVKGKPVKTELSLYVDFKLKKRK